MLMEQRVRPLNDAPVRKGGRYVLYWCRWNRRVESNYALLYAAGLGNQMNLPVVFFERITCNYPTACDRFHTFVLEGALEVAAAANRIGVAYVLQIPRTQRGHSHERRAMYEGAAVVVTDDCIRATPALDVRLVAVDSSCIVPMNAIPERSYAAYSIRPKIRKLLPQHLKPAPPVLVRRSCMESFHGIHETITARKVAGIVRECRIDHSIAPSTCFRGGRNAALRTLDRFLKDRLSRYAREKNEPSAHATSELSPYLHYGNISALEVALKVRDCAAKDKLMADEFLEELIIRRELAHNFARYTPRLDQLDALPEWALKTIRDHRRDRRDPVYSRDEF